MKKKKKKMKKMKKMKKKKKKVSAIGTREKKGGTDLWIFFQKMGWMSCQWDETEEAGNWDSFARGTVLVRLMRRKNRCLDALEGGGYGHPTYRLLFIEGE